jgi:hypothetical protein
MRGAMSMNFIKKILDLRSRKPECQALLTVDVAPSPQKIIIDNISFNHNLAKNFKPFSLDQLSGCYLIIKFFEKLGHTDLRWLAYALATAMHETAFTMQPITEQGSEAYLRSKPYFPYIGRGFVQLTHKYNYEKYGIADTPEDACDPELAAYILINGMTNGIFTGKKFSDYFNDSKSDAFNARKIINGLDRAPLVASYYDKFIGILKASSIEETKLS